jgi:hypothetical protein
MISDPAQARRLARAIASDIKVYNEDKLRNGEDLTAEIEEGRELFRERATPGMMYHYDAALIDVGLRSDIRPSNPAPPRRPAPRPMTPSPGPVIPPPQNRPAFELKTASDATPSMVPLVALATLLIVLIAGFAWWWLQRGH